MVAGFIPQPVQLCELSGASKNNQICMRKYLFCYLLCTASLSLVTSAQSLPPGQVLVKIKIIEGDTKRITPAMVCITNAKQRQIVTPPLGKIVDSASEMKIFFKGISFKKDKNWVGPVRMMQGEGNDNFRSINYGVKPSIPYWKAPVMYQTSGDFTIALPFGTWKISIQHGNEYVPVEQEFTIKKGDVNVIKSFTLKRWINLPKLGWYSGDVHVHHPTNEPDFRNYLLAFANAEDLHIVNVLQMGHHEKGLDDMGNLNSGYDFKQAGFGEKFRVNKDNYWLIAGQEDPRSVAGHIIGLNISQPVRDTSVYEYYDLVFKNLKIQPGALVGFAHFAWNVSWSFPNNATKGFPWYITTNQIDFVELLQFLKLNGLDYYEYLNLGFRIAAAAGSDFPWASTIGEVRTMVYTGNDFTPDNWFAGLKKGHTFVTNGPALFLTVDGKMPGSEIIKSKGSSVKLSVKALSNSQIGTIKRIAIHNNGGLIAEVFNKDLKDSIEIKLDHKPKRSEWIAAVVECENSAVAHTSPIYIVVDGKPTYDLIKAPVIIGRQIKYLESLINKEKSTLPLDQGIIERLETATSFYRILLQQIKQAYN